MSLNEILDAHTAFVAAQQAAGHGPTPPDPPHPLRRHDPLAVYDGVLFEVDEGTTITTRIALMDGLDAGGIGWMLGGDGIIVPTADVERAWAIVQAIING